MLNNSDKYNVKLTNNRNVRGVRGVRVKFCHQFLDVSGSAKVTLTSFT